MRSLFLLLLAANLAYGAWALLSPREAPPAPRGEPSAVGYPVLLELASEVEEVAPTPAAEAVEPPVPEQAAVEQAPAEAPATSADDGAAAAEMPAPADGGLQAPAEAPVADTAAGSAGAAVAPAGVAPPVCVQAGPVASEAVAGRLRERAAQWLDGAEVATVQVPERSVFWVHIPPRASDTEAREIVAVLAKKRVDSFVIRDEPALRNGVSLGVFRDADSARSLKERLGGIGYPVEIREEVRTRTAYLVRGRLRDGAPGPGAPLPQGLSDAVAAAAPAAAVNPADCAASAAADPGPDPGVAPATAPD
jgi:hypothetical protein